MNDLNKLLRPALVAGTLLLAAAAYAQAFNTAAPPPAAGPGAGPALPEPPAPPLPGARIDAELAYARTALAVTSGHMPAWQKVADALRESAKRHDTVILARRAKLEKIRKSGENAVMPNLIDGLENLRQEKSAEADDLAKLAAALKPFYATLTDQQKRIGEEIFRPGPGGPLRLRPQGMGMLMFDHGPMGPPHFGGDCKPGGRR